MNYTNEQAEPWHRNPWVWLIIAIPSLTILGCLLTIYLALSNPETVIGEYGLIRHLGAGTPATFGLG